MINTQVASISKVDSKISFQQLSKTTPRRSSQKRKLPNNFTPGTYSVICGRGKLYSSSPGNKYLRLLVNRHLPHYSMAKNKTEKTAIVTFIINCVREVAPSGAFVKQEDNGDWWEVDDSFSREKIGCIFRDLLHTQYRSSTKSKQARKKAMESSNHHDGDKSSSVLSAKHGTYSNMMSKFPAVVTSTSSSSDKWLPLKNSVMPPVEPRSSSAAATQPALGLQRDSDSGGRPLQSKPLSVTSAPLTQCTSGGGRASLHDNSKSNVLSLLDDALGVVDLDDLVGDEDDLNLSDIFDDGTLVW